AGEWTGNDADDLATGGERGVGQRSHQPHRAAAVDHAEAPLDESLRQLTGRFSVGRPGTHRRSGEHADALHGFLGSPPDGRDRMFARLWARGPSPSRPAARTAARSGRSARTTRFIGSPRDGRDLMFARLWARGPSPNRPAARTATRSGRSARTTRF